MLRSACLCAGLALVASNALAAPAAADKTFTQAQQAYHQKDYDRALVFIGRYLKTARSKDKRLLGMIEQGARIHLQHHHDPNAAIRFLRSIKKTKKLSRKDAEDVGQWLATAREWKKMGALTKNDSADSLFKLGQEYYRKGTDDIDGDDDETGAASRYIAAGYLVPFVLNFDSDPRLAKALLMLGDIRRRSWKADEWWTVDFYLKEVIRRFPGTPEARRAFDLLDDDIRMRWSGSRGDNTPEYLRTMLVRYRKLAYGKASSRPASRPGSR